MRHPRYSESSSSFHNEQEQTLDESRRVSHVHHEASSQIQCGSRHGPGRSHSQCSDLIPCRLRETTVSTRRPIGSSMNFSCMIQRWKRAREMPRLISPVAVYRNVIITIIIEFEPKHWRNQSLVNSKQSN
jgi:hypothetical protein